MKDEMEWKEKFVNCAKQMSIDPAKREQALYQISQAGRARKVQYCPPILEIVKMQFFCVPKSVWIFQFLFLALLPVSESLLQKHFGLKGWQIFPALSVWMAVGSVILVSELGRHFSCHMAELEQTCYLNLSQLWLLRTCCVSGVDIVTVAVFCGCRARAYGFGWFSFTVYVLTPFFAANVLLLLIFTAGRNNVQAAWFWTAFLAGSGLWLQMKCSRIYEAGWLPVWLFLLTAMIALWGIQLRTFCRKMEGEGLCLN